MTERQGRFRGSVREGFVVVISILIAFSLDAWWVRQGELRQESEIRSSLQAEFVTNRERLSGDMDYVRSYTEASARVLAATESGIEGDEEAARARASDSSAPTGSSLGSHRVATASSGARRLGCPS